MLVFSSLFFKEKMRTGKEMLTSEQFFLKLAVSGPPICIKNKSKGLGISWASRYEEKHTQILTVRERENEKAY